MTIWSFRPYLTTTSNEIQAHVIILPSSVSLNHVTLLETKRSVYLMLPYPKLCFTKFTVIIFLPLRIAGNRTPTDVTLPTPLGYPNTALSLAISSLVNRMALGALTEAICNGKRSHSTGTQGKGLGAHCFQKKCSSDWKATLMRVGRCR